MIVRYRFVGLWNSEYPLVVARIINISEKGEPHKLGFGKSFERLAAFKAELAKMVLQEKADSESAVLSELDQQRDTLFNVIYNMFKALQRTPIAEISDQAHSVVTVIKKHGVNMPSSNYTAQTKRLYDFIAEFEQNEELMKTLNAFGVAHLFYQMKEINTQFDNLFMERNLSQSQKERIDTKTLRVNCDKAIITMFNAIEACMVENGEEDYLPMVKSLNTLNSYYKNQLALRAARRKAKQAVDNEEPIKPLEE